MLKKFYLIFDSDLKNRIINFLNLLGSIKNRFRDINKFKIVFHKVVQIRPGSCDRVIRYHAFVLF